MALSLTGNSPVPIGDQYAEFLSFLVSPDKPSAGERDICELAWPAMQYTPQVFAFVAIKFNMSSRAPVKRTQKKKTPRSKKLAGKSNILKIKRTTNKVKGHGGYAEDIGSSLGSWLGKKAGGLFSSITGLGDYSVSTNTLVNPNNPPILSNTRQGTRVSHREFITDVLSTTGFTLNSYPINPGMAVTFPWLATVASCYEQYKLWGLIFEYKATSAVALNSTNTALGTVIMATEYDVSKPTFTDKRSMENYVYCTSCPPSVSALHPIECAPNANVLADLYTRSGVETGSDLRFSDLGNFQIATVGMQQGGVIIGELWCTFDVELIKPRLPVGISAVPVMHYVYDSTSFHPNGIPSATDLFGGPTTQKMVLRGSFSTSVSLVTKSINFSTPGIYLISIYVLGGAASMTGWSASFASGSGVGVGSLYDFFSVSGANNVSLIEAADSGGTIIVQLGVNVTSASPNTPAVLTLAPGVIPATPISVDLVVTTFPPGFLIETEQRTQQIEIDELKAQVNDLVNNMRSIKYAVDVDSKDDEDIQCVKGTSWAIIEDCPPSPTVLASPTFARAVKTASIRGPTRSLP